MSHPPSFFTHSPVCTYICTYRWRHPSSGKKQEEERGGVNEWRGRKPPASSTRTLSGVKDEKPESQDATLIIAGPGHLRVGEYETCRRRWKGRNVKGREGGVEGGWGGRALEGSGPLVEAAATPLAERTSRASARAEVGR